MTTTAVATSAPSAARAAARAGRQPLAAGSPTHALAIALAIMFLAPFVFIAADVADDQPAGADRDLVAELVAPGQLRRGVPDSAAAAVPAQHLLYAVLATCSCCSSSVPAAYALAKLPFRGRNVAFLRRDHLHDDAAAAGDHGAALPHVGASSAPDRDAVAADPAELLGDAFSHLPAAPVPADDPAASTSTRPGSTAAASGARCCASSCRWPGPASPRRRCSSSSRLERLLRPAALHQREPEQLDPLAGAGARSGPCTRSVEPHDGRDDAHMVPVVVLFFFAQRAFVQGVTLTGVKG